MTHDETKKEAEGKFDRKKVDDLLKEGFRKLARITPMAPDVPLSEIITSLPPEDDARLRYSFIEFILDKIDKAIDRKDESGACLFQIDDPEIQGSVTPVKSTWDGYSLLTILELKPDRETTYYVCISNGDGGVLLHRSELSRDIEGLMAVEETEEGWSDL